MGLSENDRQLLIKELNIIMNCAGNVDMGARLDLSLKVNVSAPLLLLNLAGEC